MTKAKKSHKELLQQSSHRPTDQKSLQESIPICHFSSSAVLRLLLGIPSWAQKVTTCHVHPTSEREEERKLHRRSNNKHTRGGILWLQVHGRRQQSDLHNTSEDAAATTNNHWVFIFRGGSSSSCGVTFSFPRREKHERWDFQVGLLVNKTPRVNYNTSVIDRLSIRDTFNWPGRGKKRRKRERKVTSDQWMLIWRIHLFLLRLSDFLLFMSFTDWILNRWGIEE